MNSTKNRLFLLVIAVKPSKALELSFNVVLMLIVYLGNVDDVKKMMNNNVNVDFADKDGKTNKTI